MCALPFSVAFLFLFFFVMVVSQTLYYQIVMGLKEEIRGWANENLHCFHAYKIR